MVSVGSFWFRHVPGIIFTLTIVCLGILDAIQRPDIFPAIPLLVACLVFVLLMLPGDVLPKESTDLGPVERAQQRYVDGEIGDLELEQELEDALRENQ